LIIVVDLQFEKENTNQSVLVVIVCFFSHEKGFDEKE